MDSVEAVSIVHQTEECAHQTLFPVSKNKVTILQNVCWDVEGMLAPFKRPRYNIVFAANIFPTFLQLLFEQNNVGQMLKRFKRAIAELQFIKEKILLLMDMDVMAWGTNIILSLRDSFTVTP